MRLQTRVAFIFLLLQLCLGGRGEQSAAAAAYQDGQAAEADSLLRTHGLKVNVDDMERAVSFYSEKLGFEIADRSRYPNYVILKTADRHRLVLFRVKKLARPASTETKFSFTLQVNDLDEAMEKMRRLGVEFGEAGKRKEGVGNAIYIKDPFGRLISLMHQTIVKVEPFTEPRLYNFGFLIPDMQVGRDFYSGKLGFVVRSEKYLPLDLPLGHRDKTFAFMLHYRPNVTARKIADARQAPFDTLIFETYNLQAAVKELKAKGVKIPDSQPQNGPLGRFVRLEDPFGNVSELLEVTR